MIPIGTLCVVTPPSMIHVGCFVTIAGVLRDCRNIDILGNVSIDEVVYLVEENMAHPFARRIAFRPQSLRIIRPPRSADPAPPATRDEPATAS